MGWVRLVACEAMMAADTSDQTVAGMLRFLLIYERR